jgi:hypothetical protein
MRPRGTLLLLAAATTATMLGCGKTNLVVKPQESSSRSASSAEPIQSIKTSPPKEEPTPSRARARAFAVAVLLRLDDVTGARAEKAESAHKSNSEAHECAGGARRAIGGLESSRYVRGKGLAREVISSGVAVLDSHEAAVKDILAVTSKAGVACYARVVRKSLGSGEDALELRSLSVTRLTLPLRGRVHSLGIRVAASVTSAKTRFAIPIYIDALVFADKQAEIELYASSYVQPEPRRTEQELLELMQDRARLKPL